METPKGIADIYKAPLGTITFSAGAGAMMGYSLALPEITGGIVRSTLFLAGIMSWLGYEYLTSSSITENDRIKLGDEQIRNPLKEHGGTLIKIAYPLIKTHKRRTALLFSSLIIPGVLAYGGTKKLFDNLAKQQKSKPVPVINIK